MQLPDGAALARTEAVARQVRTMIMRRPEMVDFVTIAGLNFLTNSTQSNSAVAFAILKPWAARPGAAEGKQQGKRFFFEKKNQKTLTNSG
jgi:multidrug efflux pump subunit AcrB